MHTFSPHIGGFDRLKNMAPSVYPAYVEIRKETVSSSKVYRTIHSDFMMLKRTCTVLNTALMQRSLSTQCSRFFTHDECVMVSAPVS